ncbi:hypothetical protein BVK86_02375 [Pseudomonas reinekei]|jgi:hypothetical protein|uniref:Uncharacterized protein n=1 Tax=Pseudomonas reinekei TaxID=395598 RepID=A0A1Q9X5G9_PSERE|nr:hypothetical protein BVK86_02375 [Pseudomonas reinekei]
MPSARRTGDAFLILADSLVGSQRAIGQKGIEMAIIRVRMDSHGGAVPRLSAKYAAKLEIRIPSRKAVPRDPS